MPSPQELLSRQPPILVNISIVDVAERLEHVNMAIRKRPCSRHQHIHPLRPDVRAIQVLPYPGIQHAARHMHLVHIDVQELRLGFGILPLGGRPCRVDPAHWHRCCGRSLCGDLRMRSILHSRLRAGNVPIGVRCPCTCTMQVFAAQG